MQVLPLLFADTTLSEKLVIAAIGAALTAIVGLVIWAAQRRISNASAVEQVDYAKKLTELVNQLGDDEVPVALRIHRDKILRQITHTGSRSRYTLGPQDEQRVIQAMENALAGASEAGALTDDDLQNVGILVSAAYNRSFDAQFQNLLYSGMLVAIGDKHHEVATESERKWWALWSTLAKIQFLSTSRLMQNMEIEFRDPLATVARDVSKGLVIDDLEREYRQLAAECEVPESLQRAVLNEVEFVRSLQGAPTVTDPADVDAV